MPPETIIQNAMHRVRSKHGNSTRYLGYLLRHISNSGWFDMLCNKATIFARFMNERDFQGLVSDWISRQVYGRLRVAAGKDSSQPNPAAVP